MSSTRLDGATCDHCGSDSTALRRKPASGGRVLFAYQCLICGRSASSWLKHSAIKDADGLPEWDETLADRYWRARDAVRQQDFDDGRMARKSRYQAYLRTPKWRSIRSRVLERAGGLCEGCREQDAAEVHHLTYKHLGDELLFELVALCDGCHERAHDILSESEAAA